MSHKAVKLYLEQNTTLKVLFDDGITKEYDVLSLSEKYPQLNALEDRDLFLKGKLFGWGGVIWNDDLDLDADTIYEDGITVESEDKATEIILGYNIRQARLRKQLTQEELSQLTNIDQSDISKIESGILCPTLSTIKKIARGLNEIIRINVF
ncbi:MAG: helix-turn-helix domain-containing protein [Erysipelotrichaceae bacterium]|nr:helix-turn-helix domain-containing protein [Erysipelotrichaceae bacterium]